MGSLPRIALVAWAQVHRRCGCRIFVTDRKYEIMRCLEWPGVQHLQDSREVVKEMLQCWLLAN